MTIIEIKPLENGAHDNNTIFGADPATFPIPEGWAVVPEDVELPDTFPFVDVTVNKKAKPPVVTGMTPGVVPPDPEPEPAPPTAEERLRAVEDAVLTLMMEV